MVGLLGAYIVACYGAKNIIAAGFVDKCEIQYSYVIGVAEPIAVMVDLFGTGKLSDERIIEIVRENIDLCLAEIFKMQDLRCYIFSTTAAYGHFGCTDVDLLPNNR